MINNMEKISKKEARGLIKVFNDNKVHVVRLGQILMPASLDLSEFHKHLSDCDNVIYGDYFGGEYYSVGCCYFNGEDEDNYKAVYMFKALKPVTPADSGDDK